MRNGFLGFRFTFLTVGILHVLLAGVMFLQGIIPTMAKFGIPEQVLNSPFYHDAMLYVFYHQFVNGAVLTLIGLFATDLRLQVWMVRVLSPLYLIYTYFDFRVSDSIFGNGMYQGPESLVPPLFTLLFTVLILQLNIPPLKKP